MLIVYELIMITSMKVEESWINQNHMILDVCNRVLREHVIGARLYYYDYLNIYVLNICGKREFNIRLQWSYST